MRTKTLVRLLLTMLMVVTALTAQTARRPLKLDDLVRLRDVRDPQLSPDGLWVAYVVSTTDAKEDKSNTHIWLVGYDGKTIARSPSARTAKARRAGVPMENISRSLHRDRVKPRAARCG